MDTRFDGTDDTFDSQEVIDRIEEIETDLLAEHSEDEEYTVEVDDMDDETRAEYEALKALQEAATGAIPDFEYGETFIHADFFTDYTMELLEDIGYLPADLPGWIVIDRDATADNMLADYTSFEFQGATYYAR